MLLQTRFSQLHLAFWLVNAGGKFQSMLMKPISKVLVAAVLFMLNPAFAPTTAAQNPPAKPLTALVLEHSDKWTQAAGAATALQQAGWKTVTLDFDKPLNPCGAHLILIGSFASEHPGYAAFMKQNSGPLQTFVEEGGVLVQMAQAGQTESFPYFLPRSLLAALRADPGYADLVAVTGDHPLLRGLPERNGDPRQILIPNHINRPANWEGFSRQYGFRVLLASGEDLQNFALLEGAHGRGRVVLTSLYLDKLQRDGNRLATPDFEKVTATFFTNLADYTASVQSGNAPAVVATPPPKPIEPLPFVPGSWTLAVLPDTQFYVMRHPELFDKQTRWIAENKQQHNIVYVLHLGDIVNNNNPPQWENARRSMSILDGVVPYAMAPGNHDYGDNGSANHRQTLFNDYFPIEKYRSWPTFGGAMDAGRMDNTYHVFKAGGHDWLVLALEWGPRHSAVNWANQIAAKHPNHKAILLTHAYMYSDETRYDWKTKGPAQSWNPHAYGTAKDSDGTNDGEELWQKLVRQHPGFVMTLNGHVLNDGLARLSSEGDHGNVVHQMLVNYQMKPLGGESYLRLIEFLPDGETVQVKAYSPHYDSYKTDRQNQFVLKLKPPLGMSRR